MMRPANEAQEYLQEDLAEKAKEPAAPVDDFWDKLHAAYTRSERFPGEHNCPRGAESGRAGRAVWCVDDSCSYCGSLHPDLLMERLEAGDVTLDPTDKNYKLYVHADPGTAPFKQTFRDSGSPEGNDPSKWVWTTRETMEHKFYFQHLSGAQQQRFVELLNAKKLKLNVPGYFYRTPFFIEKL